MRSSSYFTVIHLGVMKYCLWLIYDLWENKTKLWSNILQVSVGVCLSKVIRVLPHQIENIDIELFPILRISSSEQHFSISLTNLFGQSVAFIKLLTLSKFSMMWTSMFGPLVRQSLNFFSSKAINATICHLHLTWRKPYE